MARARLLVLSLLAAGCGASAPSAMEATSASQPPPEPAGTATSGTQGDAIAPDKATPEETAEDKKEDRDVKPPDPAVIVGEAGGEGATGEEAPTGTRGPGASSMDDMKAPPGRATVESVKVDTSAPGNASAVVYGLGPSFRRCYRQGLEVNPTQAGTLRITARVGPKGEVISASSGGSGLDQAVVACIIARVKAAQFAAPQDGGTTLVFTLKFSPQ